MIQKDVFNNPIQGCKHSKRNQRCQGKSPFPRIACDMWNSCVGLLFNLKKKSYPITTTCYRYKFFLLCFDPISCTHLCSLPHKKMNNLVKANFQIS